jgi:hemoglobin
MEDPTAEIYAQIGDDQPFYDLVDVFYAGVDADPILRPLYPDDLTKAKEHLALFLIQRFGGHARYQTERGHPRLRMRHVPFQIGPVESEAWLRHMFHAVDTVPEFSPFRDILRSYFSDSAAFLINHSEIPALGSR